MMTVVYPFEWGIPYDMGCAANNISLDMERTYTDSIPPPKKNSEHNDNLFPPPHIAL